MLDLSSLVLILLAPFLGVLVGLIPTVGALIALILLYPLLLHFTPLVLIIFYALLINARDFSGSVSAINLGILGETNSIPVLKERDLIVNNNAQLTALKNTMIGSVFGTVVALLILLVSVIFAVNYPWLLRTDVLGVCILITLVFLTQWHGNTWVMNIILILGGYVLSMVGWDNINKVDILTFGNVYLSGGIPMLPFLFGIYAIPKMLEIVNNNKPWVSTVISKETVTTKINIFSLLRGTAIGSIMGLVPFIGNIISSNMAHMIEQFFYKEKNKDHALYRITAAETANNASQITMLIPFILLGIALSPSELLLLDTIIDKGWMPTNSIDWRLLLGLIVASLYGCLVSSVLCYGLVKKMLHFFVTKQKVILVCLMLITVIDVLYLGYNSDQMLFWGVVLVTSFIAGMVLIKHNIDAVPLIITMLVGTLFYGVLNRIPQLYF
jgi:putative tricarboxylic transport membrane protein